MQKYVVPSGAKVLGDVMGSNPNSYGTLFTNLHTLNENSNPNDTIEYVGLCGETAAHIATYKNDLKLLEIILRNGFHPNTKNQKGETIMHIAARLGDLDTVKLIYGTAKCELDTLNLEELTALDLTQRSIEEKELFELRIFRTWSRGDDNDISIDKILRGRKSCEIFLKEKVNIDRHARTNKILEDTVTFNKNRTIASRMIRGISADQNFRAFTNLSYPISENKKKDVDDIKFFEEGWGYAVGFRLVVIRIYASEFINRSLKVGYNNVILTLSKRHRN
jgi:hypothetical protein